MKGSSVGLYYDREDRLPGFYRGNNAHRFKNIRNRSNLEFKSNFLDTIGRFGSTPMAAPFISSAGILAIRPAITMMDKKTPKEDRIYSASWQAGISTAGLGIILTYGEKIKNFSNYLAGKILGIKFSNADKALAESQSHIVDAVLRDNPNSRYSINKIIHASTKETKQLVEELGEEYSRRNKTTLKGIFDTLNIFKRTKEISNPIELNPALVHEIRDKVGKSSIKEGIDKNIQGLISEFINTPEQAKQRAGRILIKTGVTKITNFVILMSTLTAGTYLVTRYLDPMMKFAGRTFNIKALQKGVEPDKKADSENKEKKEKWGLFDKTIFAGLGALVAIEGANIAGKFFGKKNIAYQSIGKIFKGINEKLNVSQTIGRIMKKPMEGLRNLAGFKDFQNKMAEQANVNDKWVERSVIFNLIARLAINVPTGQYYNATRDVVDQIMPLALMRSAEKTIINPAKKGLAKMFGVPEYNQGVQVIADQGIKNLLIIGVVMGFLNNAISSRCIKVLEKTGLIESDKEKEMNYMEYRRKFLTAQRLKEFKLNAAGLRIEEFYNDNIITQPSSLSSIIPQ